MAPPLNTVVHFISGDLWAGAEVMAWRLLEKLAAYPDIALSVILCNEGRLHDNLVSLNVETIILDETKLSPFELFTQLQGYIRHKNPDVLHCHRYKENLLGYLAGRYTKVPALITTQHGMPESFRGMAHIKSRFFSLCNFFIQKHFNAVITVSDDIEQSFINAQSFPTHTVYTIRNGVPLPAHQSINFPNEHFIIGSAGRFTPVKDYSLMVQTAALVSQEGPASRFVLAGDGPLREQIEFSVKTFNLAECFTLTGALPDMENFYLGLDLYINTSLHEGIPMTILEAMSYGVPVVACDVGGIREIINDGIDGFLVPSRNPQALAEKCLLLHRDKELWKKMSAAARRKIEDKFSATYMAEQYLALYRRVVDKYQRDQ